MFPAFCRQPVCGIDGVFRLLLTSKVKKEHAPFSLLTNLTQFACMYVARERGRSPTSLDIVWLLQLPPGGAVLVHSQHQQALALALTRDDDVVGEDTGPAPGTDLLEGWI